MSPFKSKSQQRYMFAKHPKIAKRWANKYGISKNMPEKMSKAGMSRKRKYMHGSGNLMGEACLRKVGALE